MPRRCLIDMRGCQMLFASLFAAMLLMLHATLITIRYAAFFSRFRHYAL